MIEELIYTSAPQGLKPGSSGFTTVASTAGMASNLANLLESLSGYRHLADPGTAGAKQNPVIFSHLKGRVGGRNLNILSRIADAGLDYSGRTNKLAHHVVFSSMRLPTAGPAALQVQRDFHATSWSGEPRIIAEAKTVRALATEPGVCKYWETICGDAGWGGEVATRLRRADGPEQWIIYPLSVDPLTLLQESLALLSDEERWRITYTTFYTKLPPGVDCRVRFAVDGTAEAQQLRRRYELQVLDLCTQLPAAPDSPLAVVARTGVLPVKQQSTPTMALEQSDEFILLPESELVEGLPELESSSPPPLPNKRAIKVVPSYSQYQGDNEGKGAWLLAVAILLMLLLIGAGIAGYMSYKRGWFSEKAVAAVAPKGSKEKVTETDDLTGNRNKGKIVEHKIPSTAPAVAPKNNASQPQPLSSDSTDITQAVPEDVTLPTDDTLNQESDKKPSEQGPESEEMSSNNSVILAESADQQKLPNELKSPFPSKEFFIKDFWIHGSDELPLILGDQDLSVSFWYPKPEQEKEPYPFFIRKTDQSWTLEISTAMGPSTDSLLKATYSNKKLTVIQQKALKDKSTKFKRTIEMSTLKLSTFEKSTQNKNSCSLFFYKPLPQLVVAPALIPPGKQSTSLLNDLKLWDSPPSNWLVNWTLKDTEAPSLYFINVKSSDHKEDTTIDINFQVDNYFVYSHSAHQGTFFSVYLDIAVARNKRVLDVSKNWRLESNQLQLTEPRFTALADAIDIANKRLSFRSHYQLPAENVLAWNELGNKLLGRDAETDFPTFDKTQLKEAANKYTELNSLDLPESFNPPLILEELESVRCDIELGVYLIAAREDRSKSKVKDPKTRKQVLISTIRGESKDNK